MRAKRLLRGLAIAGGGLLGLLLLAGGAGYAWLQTDGGKAWVARQAEAALSEPGVSEVRIGALRGRLPQALEVEGLRIEDREGLWLTGERLELRWRPFALLRGRLEIEAVTAGRIEVLRAPLAEEDTEAESAGLGLPPELPFQVIVEEIALDELSLGAPILGEPARFRLNGESRAAQDGSIEARLEARRSDGAEGRLQAKGAYRAATGELELDLDLAEPQGGLVVHLLDVPHRPAIAVTLAGRGPLDGWSGRLTADLQGVIEAQADLSLARKDALVFSLSAEAEARQASSEAPWPLLAGRQTLQATGEWQDDEALVIEHLALSGPQLDATGTAHLGLADDGLQAELAVTLKDQDTVAAWLGAQRLEGAKAQIRLGGRLSEPEIEARLTAEQLAIDGMVASDLALQAKTEAQTALFDSAARTGISADFRIGDLDLDDGELQALAGRSFSGTLNGKLDLAASELAAERLTLASEAFEVEAQGRLNFDDGSGSFESKGQYFDLSRLDALTGLELKGAAQLEGPWSMADFGERLSGQLQGRLTEVNSGIGPLAALLAGRADLAAKLDLTPAGLDLQALEVSTDAATVAGTLALTQNYEQIAGDLRLTLPDSGVLSDALGITLRGAGQVDTRLEGPAEAPVLAGTAGISGLSLEGIDLSDVFLDYRTESLDPVLAASLSAKADSELGGLTARSGLKIEGERLQLSALELELPDGKMTGGITAPLDGGPLAGELQAEAKALGRLLAAAGLTGGGQGKADIRLRALEGRQAAEVTAALQDISLSQAAGAPPLEIARLDVRLTGDDLLTALEGQAEVAAQGVSWSDLSLETLALDASGGEQALALDLRTEGRWIEDLSLDAAGTLSLASDGLTARLERAEGQALGEGFRLQAPAELQRKGKTWRLSGLRAGFGPGNLAADATLGGKTLDATLKAEDLPAELLDLAAPLGLSGRVSADAKLDGPAAAPSGRFSLAAVDLKTTELAGAPESELSLQGTWQNGRLAMEGKLRADQAGETPPAKLAADLPLRWDAATPSLEVPQDEPVSGAFSWQGEVAQLLALVPVADHRFKGQGDISLALSGSLAKPQVQGRAALDKAEYESLEAGTLLSDLDLEIELDRDSARIVSLTASDGNKGQLTGTGRLTFDAARAFPYELALDVENFHLVRRDDVTGSASGRLEMRGDTKTGQAIGRLVTQRVEASITGALPPEVVKLDVIESDGGEEAEPPTPEAGYDLGLQLEVSLPQEVFVRGRGLDSEWSGQLLVTGTAAEPQISGEIVLVRGRLSVVGKSFTLQSGRIKLPKDAAGEPELDITARHETQDLVVTAKLTGPLSGPEISLSSQPDLPRDEIISRVLFNKGVANLSAIEAAQLAAAIPELTGKGGGFDIMGFARQMVGVDVLQIETVEGENGSTPAVAAGKYVTEEVYLGVEQGATPESGSVGVEVELTPNISLESEVKRSGATKSGVKFKLDY